MGMHPVDFTTFAASVSKVAMNDKRVFLNAASLQGYPTLQRMWRGTKQNKILRGGQYIAERILTSVVSRSEEYLPGQPANFAQSNPGTDLQYGWRFQRHPMSWQEENMILQGADNMTGEARMIVYQDQMDQILAEFWTGVSNFYEPLFWRVPVAGMEGLNTKEFASIPFFINGYANNLWNDNVTTLTTIGGQSPSTIGANWQPQKVTYDNFTKADPANFIRGMRKMKRKIEFKKSPIQSDKFTETGMLKSDVVCYASEWGISQIEQLYLNSQDRWLDPTDPFGAVTFDGMPFEYCPQKDTAAIVANAGGAAAGTEQSATVTGPRFEIVNTTHLRMVMHRDRVFHTKGPKSDVRTETSMVQNFYVFSQLICNNLRSCGLLSPRISITYS